MISAKMLGVIVRDLPVLAGILKRLSEVTGKNYDASGFSSRLRIQKSIYLLSVMGMGEVRGYGFSYYVRGPYCPSLAKDYYSLAESKPVPADVKIPEKCLKVVTECVSRGDAFLEAVSTVHSIAKIRCSRDKATVIGLARSTKPQLSHKYDEAWDYLYETGLL